MTPPPRNRTVVHFTKSRKTSEEERREQSRRKLETEKRRASAMSDDPGAWIPGIINLPWDTPSDEDETTSVHCLHSLVASNPGTDEAVIFPHPEPRGVGQEVVMEHEDGEEEIVPRGRCRYFTAGLLVMLLVVATVSVVAVIFLGGNDASSEEPQSNIVGQTASSRKQAFQIIVEDLSGVDLLKEDTPQFKALQWLVWQDPAKLEPTADERQIQERYILAVFFFGTTGEEWLDWYGFVSENHVCDWNNQDFGMGVTCDQASKTVQALQIGPNNLKGTLPNEIFLLQGLTSFQIVSNKDLVGTIPSTIGTLTSLELLNLNKNSLTGLVPDSLLKLPSLTTIWMDGNSFEGEYPPIGDDSTLQWWSCNQCGLQGEISVTLQYPSESTLRSHLK